MSDSVQGIYGGLAWLKGEDVVLKFLDGLVKVVDAGALKASLEDKKPIMAEGMLIFPFPMVTRIQYDDDQVLSFATDELLEILK